MPGNRGLAGGAAKNWKNTQQPAMPGNRGLADGAAKNWKNTQRLAMHCNTLFSAGAKKLPLFPKTHIYILLATHTT